MEDLAHFIQSMSEKYGLLDPSYKQHQQGPNDNQQHLQDHTSSAASNTLNSEDYKGSNWECLSIFISGSQSIDCKNVPSGPHSLPPLAKPKKLTNPLQQQQAENNGTGSPPHCLSKLIDIDENESPSLYNASKGTNQQQQESPDDDLSHLGASSTVLSSDLAERGTMFDSCGDPSTAVTMADYIQQCYNPRDEYNNNLDGPRPAGNSYPGPSFITKNSGHAQQLQQSTMNAGAAAATNSAGSSTIELQEMHSTKANEESGGVPFKDSKECLLHTSLSQEDKNSFEHKSANVIAAASGLEQMQQARNTSRLFEHKSAVAIAAASGIGLELQQMQQAWNRRQREVSSVASVGMDTPAESGDIDVALHEYEISSGRTTRTSIYTVGCCHEAHQTDLREETTKDKVNKMSFGGRPSSRGQYYHAPESDSAAQSFDAFPSFDSQGEHQEKGMRGISGYSCSSTEISAPAENNYHQQQQGNHQGFAETGFHHQQQGSHHESAENGYHHQQQGNHHETAENGCNHHQQQGSYHGSAVSPSSKAYLPISSAMESRVAQLDEASKEFFASSRNNIAQNSNRLNLTSGIYDDDEFRHNSGTSSEKPPVLKKARSFREFSHATSAAWKGDRNPTLSMQKGNTAPSVKISSGDLESNPDKWPGASVANSGTLPDNPHNTAEEAKFVETWEQVEALHKVAGMEGGAVREPKWSYINKLLSENGFSPLDWQLITGATEVADKFFHTLNEVVRNYGRREKVLKELLAEREALRQEENRSNEIMHKLEHETDLIKRKLATSEQRAEIANAAAEKAFAVLRKDNQRLEASHASMLQRCSQLEHASRAKERALRKLQEKIQESVQREERRRQKEKELYEKLKHKIAVGQKSQGDVIESNFLLRDLKPATIVGIYERQRAAAQVEINNLREENLRLCRELREKENSLLSKREKGLQMQTLSTAEVAQPGFDERENALFRQLTEIDNVLKTKTFCGQKMARRGDAALLPLEMNRKEDLKKDSDNLQVQLKSHAATKQNLSVSFLQTLQMDAAQGTKSHNALQETSRKQLDLNSSSALLTCNSNGCTSLKCHKFLQGICTRLKVSDPGCITGAIDGLLKLVAAVPRMETFIEQVCDIFFNDGAMILGRERNNDMQETPEAVPGILKSWLEQLRSVQELQHFKESVSAQLWERFDEKAIKHPMSARVAAASVKDLIDIERQYLLSQASYREAHITLKAEPEKLLHRIISHFQMLFEISQLEGVMAVMNSVYIQISEYHNFARALCSMLGLPKDARPNSIISTVTSILNKVFDRPLLHEASFETNVPTPAYLKCKILGGTRRRKHGAEFSEANGKELNNTNRLKNFPRVCRGLS